MTACNSIQIQKQVEAGEWERWCVFEREGGGEGGGAGAREREREREGEMHTHTHTHTHAGYVCACVCVGGRATTVLGLVHANLLTLRTIVVSKLMTTCHHPVGTTIVSPGAWRHSTGFHAANQSGDVFDSASIFG